ncbi:MAG: hypothetical protein EB127_12495 [Alphaproteobacteria bacterium]|nr:hypothetical protein [Alphaproteobacteria bacterium]
MDVCDIQCQRDKQLKTLNSAMVAAIQNKDTNPEAYEKAKVAYYTFKEGQEWASKDTEEKANQAVQPILDSYQSKFDKMKQDVQYRTLHLQAKQDALNSQVGDEDEVRFIQSQVEKEREAASVYRRTKELEGLPVDVYAWLPSFLDLLLSITILWVVYQIFIQGKLSALFTSNSPSG